VPPPLPLPRYGVRSLAELLGSLLSSLGADGFGNPFQLQPAARACLVLVDGLGWEALRARQLQAPFLNSIAGEPMTAGFPATTAASLSSLALGLPPGEHGLVGYTIALPGRDRALNALTWAAYGLGPRIDLRAEIPPERFQPLPTLAERAATAGVTVHHLGPAFHEGSGLTRAIGRGERFHAADSLPIVTRKALDLLGTGPMLVFGYHPGLDAAGHVYGVASQQWEDELRAIDHGIGELASRLPAGTLLVVTGDHGMVDLRADQRLDLADHPELAAGVELLAGEARARSIRTRAGASEDVLAAWRSRLGQRMWVWSRDEAIASGIFGPRIGEAAAARIGDVVAAAFEPVGIVQRDVDPAQARLNGHHGSLTTAEQLLPFLAFRA
jgi:Type I phosphodiesterase / nucleotide pyrophosphatase